MKLTHLKAHRYKSIQDLEFDIPQVSILLGMNCSGKSNLLGALAFFAEGMHAKDFDPGIVERRGFSSIAWWGAEPSETSLETRYEDGSSVFKWER